MLNRNVREIETREREREKERERERERQRVITNAGRENKM